MNKMSPGILRFFCIAAMALSVFSCKTDAEIDCDAVLFGIPGDRTGLSAEECRMVCECKGYEPRDFSPAEIAALREWILLEPPVPLTSNPYDSPEPEVSTGVCAVVVVNASEKQYRLQGFSSVAEAEGAGAIVTHHGPCGQCSSLQDLAVYLETRDLGTPVRACGFLNIAAPFSDLEDCIRDLGFSDACANIWAYNARNTQAECFEPCIESILSELLLGVPIPYNNPDGSLSPCIACDEAISGPIFKAYAGRTRRNSGVASGICRTCEGVVPVAHDYPF